MRSGFADAFIPNATLRFGNAPAIHGKPAIEAAIADFFCTFIDLSHQEKNAWLIGDTLILEAVVTYTRHDGEQVTIPAVTIFHLVETLPRPLADECRIYVDLAPLYAES